jgi:hypothetical protein
VHITTVEPQAGAMGWNDSHDGSRGKANCVGVLGAALVVNHLVHK